MLSLNISAWVMADLPSAASLFNNDESPGFNWGNVFTGFSLVEKRKFWKEHVGVWSFLYALRYGLAEHCIQAFVVADQKGPKTFCCVSYLLHVCSHYYFSRATKHLILPRSSGPPYGTSSFLFFSTAGWPSVLWRTWLWVPKWISAIASVNSLFTINTLTALLMEMLPVTLRHERFPLQRAPPRLWLSSSCVDPSGPVLGDNSGACFHFAALLCNKPSQQRESSKTSAVVPSASII